MIQDHGVRPGQFFQHLDYFFGFRAIGDADRDTDTVFHCRTAALVGDLGVAHHGIRDGDLHIVARQEAGRAHAQFRHHAPFPGIEHDVIPDFVRRVRDDGHARNQIGQRVTGGEANRDTDYAGRCQPGRAVDVPQSHEQPNQNAQQDQLDAHLEQRAGARLEDFEPRTVSRHGRDGNGGGFQPGPAPENQQQ